MTSVSLDLQNRAVQKNIHCPKGETDLIGRETASSRTPLRPGWPVLVHRRELLEHPSDDPEALFTICVFAGRGDRNSDPTRVCLILANTHGANGPEDIGLEET